MKGLTINAPILSVVTAYTDVSLNEQNRSCWRHVCNSQWQQQRMLLYFQITSRHYSVERMFYKSLPASVTSLTSRVSLACLWLDHHFPCCSSFTGYLLKPNKLCSLVCMCVCTALSTERQHCAVSNGTSWLVSVSSMLWVHVKLLYRIVLWRSGHSTGHSRCK